MKFADNISVSSTDIAVIGMAGRFPGADNIRQFWENLCGGVESISFFSEDQLIENGIAQSIVTKPNYVKAAGILNDIEGFDAGFFGYSPKEAAMIDPQHRIFLETCWHALEDAGCNPDSYDGLIGLYAGASLNTYLLNNLYSNRQVMEAGGGYHMMVASDKDFLTTRVCYKLNLKGPGVTVQTACSTSLVAIHLACQSIRNGECDIAMAGGVSVRVPHINGYMYHEGIVLSKDGKCRTFDTDASGTVPGSGAGVVVLKLLEDAIADGDFIYSVIKGSTINNDGSLKAGYTAPGLEAQAAAIAEAHGVADTAPDTITYIEAHGTGTPIGDPIEIAALTKAFRQKTDKCGFCGIGSVKTNIGHLDAAAGVAGFIKTSLCLLNKKIPPTLNYNTPNAKINLLSSPFYINDMLTEWESKDGKRRAGISSFGIGGTNSHAILDEAPLRKPSSAEYPFKLLVLSAQSQNALNTLCGQISEYLMNDTGETLEDIAYTLQTGRKSFAYKKYLVVRDKTEASALLQKSKEKAAMAQFASTNSSEETWRVLLAFEGETHYFEKASELYSNLPRFRELIDSCIKILKENYGILIDAYELFNKVSVKDGQPEKSQSNVSRLIFRYSLSALLSDLGADIYWITGNEGNSLTSVVALKKKKFTDMLDEFMKPDKRNGISYGLTENESGPNKASEESFEYIKITENTGLKEFLDIVGRLWLSGTEINWKTIYADERRLKVPLPKYPFQHQKFWMNPLTEAKPLERKYENDMEKVQAEIKKSRNEIDQWFYTQVWKRFTGAFEYKNDRQKRDIILFDYNGENSFTNFLRHKENNVIKVVPGEQFKFSREHGYTINPLNKEDYQRLFDELSEMGITPGVIIHSWCVRSKVDHDAIARADRSVDMGVNSIAMLLKIINSNKSYKNIEITVVTENANDVTGTETLAPENALIMGAFNVAQLEYPNIMMKYIDVDLPLSEDRIYTMENIYGIIFGTDFGIRCALRGRHIWQRSFEQLPTYAFDRKNSKLKDGGVYLITGGFGGIGFTFAKYLAANYKAKLVLLGRKGIQHDIAFAAPSDVKKTKDAENKVSELERYGAEVLAVSGDVSDKAAMEKLKAGIIERFGRIDGIIHAAGIPGEGLIELKKPEETRAVLKPKVFGTLVLNQVFGDDLDFMVLCSSINSICARAGQYDYAAANAFLDAFAQHKANSGVTNVISLNWDTWNETGMAAEYAGIAGIDKNHFEYHPLLGECLYSVENQIIYKTILSLNNWELSEHAIAGKPTLPGTAFIEMIYGMAKRHLGKGIVELNNINFMTPVAIESGEMEILTILKQEAGTWNFTVLSQNEDGKAHYHAVGKIKLSDKTEQQTKKLNWDKDNFNVDAEPLGKTKFGMYNIERRKIMRGELAVDSLVISQQDSEGVLRTMEFGPRWNTLRSVKYSDNEAVGLFEPEADLTEDYKMYANHPALLDFATSFFRLYKSPEVFLPFSYKKITFFKPLKGPFSSWVRQVYKDKDKVNDNTMSFNISLFDAHGSHLLEIEEFSVIRVDNYKKLEHGAVKSKTLEKTYGLKERLIIEDIEPGIRNHEGIQVLETALKAATQHIVISTRDLSMRMNRINELAKLYSDSSYQNKSSVIKGRRPEMNVPYVAPQNETEKLIASIWSDAMGIEQIGINDNYFDLGGDSLLITEIHSKFLDKTGVEISVANMLQYNTVAAISAFIDEKGNNNEEKLKKIENIDTITDKRRESLKKIREKALIKNEFINYREE